MITVVPQKGANEMSKIRNCGYYTIKRSTFKSRSKKKKRETDDTIATMLYKYHTFFRGFFKLLSQQQARCRHVYMYIYRCSEITVVKFTKKKLKTPREKFSAPRDNFAPAPPEYTFSLSFETRENSFQAFASVIAARIIQFALPA